MKEKILIVQLQEENPTQSAQSENKLIAIIREVDYIENQDIYIDPIMGWIGSNNTLKQIRLTFSTIEDAEKYGAKYNYKVLIKQNNRYIAPQNRKSYSENFK